MVGSRSGGASTGRAAPGDAQQRRRPWCTRQTALRVCPDAGAHARASQHLTASTSAWRKSPFCKVNASGTVVQPVQLVVLVGKASLGAGRHAGFGFEAATGTVSEPGGYRALLCSINDHSTNLLPMNSSIEIAVPHTCTLEVTSGNPSFNERERRHLLASPRLGPALVGRLEQFGITSIDAMRSMGVDAILRALSEPGHNKALLNRRRALLRAIQHYC